MGLMFYDNQSKRFLNKTEMKENKKVNGVWYLDYRDQNDKRHRVRAGLTKKEAELKKGEIKGQVHDKTHIPKTEIPTFAELGREYLKAESPSLALASIKTYENYLNNYFIPYFGNIRLDEINVALIEGFLNKCHTERGLSRGYSNKLITHLGTILSYGERLGLCLSNPVNKVKKIKKPPHIKEGEKITSATVLSLGGIRRFLDHAPEGYKPLLTTAVFTGLRQGEILALRWDDIDWEKNQICVRRSLARQSNGEGKPVFNTPKTEAGYRRVDMDTMVIKTLKEWSAIRQLEFETARDWVKENIKTYNLVFPNSWGTPEKHGNMLNKGFYPALKDSKAKKIRFHDLRHTYASLLIASRANIVYISKQLGHSKPDMTLRVYAHIFEDHAESALVRLSDRVFNEQKAASFSPGFSP